MAAVTNLSLGGQQSGTGEARALFLKVFSGEVMHAYERAIKVSSLITTRTISSGKSAQFPTTGVALARYFTPGENLLVDASLDGSPVHSYTSNIKQSERVIHIDNLLTASCFIDELDEAISHYDYRSAFSVELGRALARHQDNYALWTLISSTQNNGTVAGEETPGDNNADETCALFYTNPDASVEAIYNCSQKLDEVDVPREGRKVLMPPIAYYNLLKAGVLSIGMHATNDTRPSYSGDSRGEPSGTMIAGMEVVVTNADGFTTSDSADNAGIMADTKGGETATLAETEDAGMRNLAAAGGLATGFDGVASTQLDTKAAAIVFHPSAAGIVKLKDVTMESEYIIERQGTLMVAKLAQGMGALRNDGAVLITTD